MTKQAISPLGQRMIDDMAIRKGHTYRIVVSDLVRRRQIEGCRWINCPWAAMASKYSA